ncbi:MAG TPA: class I mannose-6-phosphate isomerase [Bryobacteraceae bacterium]|nr:class I mannose-6-phosphate isomerase [Bryobacteraceae bacterium]
MSSPVRLVPSPREKLWGVYDTGPWFEAAGKKIGEVWFLGPDGEPLPQLVKFVFTSEKLSVQVHPGDEYAWKYEGTPGKTEMWHVLRAGPGAAIALGLKQRISRERLREAALSGEIEALLEWVPVEAGDTIFTPTGTIHAIGPEVALVEIQQQSDITYRLYDYGRPRQLHLEKALDVSDPGPHPGKAKPVEVAPGVQRLVECAYFTTELLEVRGSYRCVPDDARPQILVAVEGCGVLAGEAFAAGAAWQVPAGGEAFAIVSEGCRVLRTHAC